MSALFKRIGKGALIGLLVALSVSWGTEKIPFIKDLLDGYEFLSYDSRMQAKSAGIEEASIEDVVIIDIEQMSVSPVEEGGLGSYNDWPHAYHGQLVDVVTSGQPKALLFDIIFDPENSSNYDLVSALSKSGLPGDENISAAARQFLINNDPARLVEATNRSQKTYHALVFEDEDTLNFLYSMDAEPEGYSYDNHIIRGIPREIALQLPAADRLGNKHVDLLTAAVGAGSANFPQDEDGVIRRTPTAIYFDGADHVYPSLVMAAAIDILGIKKDGGFDYDFDNHVLRLIDTTDVIVREIPIDDKGRMYVNYQGPFKTFYYLPYMYCFDPEMLPPEYWEGKVAMVGASLPGEMDLRNTSVQETFAGVEIHANVMYSLLQNEFVKPTDSWTNFLVILMICIVGGAIISIPVKPLYTLIIPILGMLGWVIFTYDQFLSKLIMWEAVRPAISMGGTYLGIFLYNFLVVEKDKRFLKNTFSTYISPELIDQMFSDKQEPKLGGQVGVHTAFFSDIQSFSSFSEVLEPEELVALMNEYLTEMTDILLDHRGTLDKYIGDAIVAFYGAPVAVENHEIEACNTALDMEKRLSKLREKWAASGDWPEIVHETRHRVGISSGKIVTGNMGSNMRMNYTMMGDTVNMAARLEPAAKQYGVYILVSEFTYAAVKDKYAWRFIDNVRVKGKSKPVKIFELLSSKEDLSPANSQLIDTFERGIDFFLKQNWASALKEFRNAEKMEEKFPYRPTTPSAVYIERCEYFQENNPGKDWDGVWVMTKK